MAEDRNPPFGLPKVGSLFGNMTGTPLPACQQQRCLLRLSAALSAMSVHSVVCHVCQQQRCHLLRIDGV
jgi:hypothetical protein